MIFCIAKGQGSRVTLDDVHRWEHDAYTNGSNLEIDSADWK